MKIIAHRGASKEAPENTLSSIQKALEIGVDCIEIDVHLSRDGVPVVVHDALLGRTTGHEFKGRVIDLDVPALKTLDVGTWFNEAFKGERIPTLGEILSLNRRSTGLMIEIKEGDAPPHLLANAVVDCLAQHAAQNIILGSFSPLILEECHRLDPSLELTGIAEDVAMLEAFRRLPLKQMALWDKIINAQVMTQLKNLGVTVWSFTVDNRATVLRLQALGLDGVITNDPRMMKTYLASD